MLRLTLVTLLVNVLAKPYTDFADFCKDRKPGLFSQGCSSNVTVCNKFGRELFLLCPFGLVFDGSIEECKDQKLVAECADVTEKSRAMGRNLDGLPAHLCESSPDGFHAATECSTSVVQCNAGVPSLLECPGGQVFDNSKYECAPASAVPGCKPAADVPNSSNDCEDLGDGLFEKEPCSSFFLTCSGGVSRIMSCPANLVFDKRFSLCEYPGNVEGCSSVPSTSVSEVCLEDGFFSYGNCSDLFYGCSNGRKIPMYCPAKLAFDESRQLCDYPDAVPSCNAEGSALPAEDANSGYGPMVEESWDSTVETEASAQPPEQLSSFCEAREDGFYAAGCSSEMIACVAGHPTSMMCPAHLIYDEKKQYCEYPENVPCYVAAMNSGEKLEACSKEGPSANGPCSNTFTNCVEGKAYHLACDEGFVFSAAHESCVEPSKLKECMSAAPPALDVTTEYST